MIESTYLATIEGLTISCPGVYSDGAGAYVSMTHDRHKGYAGRSERE